MTISHNHSPLTATLREDFRRLNMRRTGFLAMLAALFLRPGFLAVFLHRLAAACQSQGLLGRIAAKFFWRVNVLLNGCDISPKAIIGAGLHLPHPVGVVVGPTTIGCHVRLLHNVTVGMRNFTVNEVAPANYPTIADRAEICAGAVILGPITVGEGAMVGANAVVVKDVPPHHLAVGVPAQIKAREAR